MRVLVTGMGGELGTRVAQLLEERSEVKEIVGVDFVPPRRRLRRSEFRRVDPREREKLTDIVTDFAPHAVAHFGVYEPAVAVAPRLAAEYTRRVQSRRSVPPRGPAARARRAAQRPRGLRPRSRPSGRPRRDRAGRAHHAVRPAVSRGRGARRGPRPASRVPGRRAAHGARGRLARAVAARSVAAAPRRPGPCARGPGVPAAAPGGRRRSVSSRRCSASTVRSTSSVRVRPASGRRCASVVASRGRSSGPDGLATRVAELAGAPVPPHILELMTKGRTADGSKAVEVLELCSMRPTQEVCTELFEWAKVTPLRTGMPIAQVGS